jgi:hypothetical protein
MAVPAAVPALIMPLAVVEGPVAIVEPAVQVRMLHIQLGVTVLAAMVLAVPPAVVVPLLDLAEVHQVGAGLAYMALDPWLLDPMSLDTLVSVVYQRIPPLVYQRALATHGGATVVLVVVPLACLPVLVLPVASTVVVVGAALPTMVLFSLLTVLAEP